MPAPKNKEIQLIPREQFLKAVTNLALEIEQKTDSLPTCKTKGKIVSDGVLNGYTWETIGNQVKRHGFSNLTDLFVSEGMKNPPPVKKEPPKVTRPIYAGWGDPTISGKESREALKIMTLQPPLVSGR
ncbi:MAG: hypothetical protein DHS20C02_00470 [Micavibrio sp.]|nr:MAG: hypothetical protein DHS20C02_00470 [Micavibrio sp.]